MKGNTNNIEMFNTESITNQINKIIKDGLADLLHEFLFNYKLFEENYNAVLNLPAFKNKKTDAFKVPTLNKYLVISFDPGPDNPSRNTLSASGSAFASSAETFLATVARTLPRAVPPIRGGFGAA